MIALFATLDQTDGLCRFVEFHGFEFRLLFLFSLLDFSGFMSNLSKIELDCLVNPRLRRVRSISRKGLPL